MYPEHRASAQDPAPNAAPEYEDQLIEGGNLAPDVSDEHVCGTRFQRMAKVVSDSIHD